MVKKSTVLWWFIKCLLSGASIGIGLKFAVCGPIFALINLIDALVLVIFGFLMFFETIFKVYITLGKELGNR